MLKLKKSVVEFIKANVRPSLVEKRIKSIENTSSDITPNYWRFDKHETTTGVEFSLTVAPIDFEEVEELKPYKWYPREKWDENPKGYWLIECTRCGLCELKTNPMATNSIDVVTAYFMYIEPLENDDEYLETFY